MVSILIWCNSSSFPEPPYHFTRKLKDTETTVKESVALRCEVDDDDANVKWFKDGDVSQIMIVADALFTSCVLRYPRACSSEHV
jgi:hypothetical protein